MFLRQLLIKLSLGKVIGLGQTLNSPPLVRLKRPGGFHGNQQQPSWVLNARMSRNRGTRGHHRPTCLPSASGGSDCFSFMASLFHFPVHQSKQGNSSQTTDSHAGGVTPLRLAGSITMFVQAQTGGRIFKGQKALAFL